MNTLTTGIAFVLAAALACGPAAANDSSGFQGTGGIELSANNDVQMTSEDLYISPTEIRVSYVFRNVTDHPVTTMVVFPFPDLDLSEGLTASNWAFPVKSANFLNFKVWVDDRPAKPTLERRAFFKGRDVTQEVAAAGALDIVPWRDGAYESETAALAKPALERLRRDGLLADGEDPDTPQWQLRTRYFWTQTFPPGRDVKVRLTYRPFVGRALIGKTGTIDGRTVVGNLVGERATGGDRYCLDEGTRRALAAAARRGTNIEDVAELEYVLITARNWRGPIGRFRLTIDKGAPQSIISLCWHGLRRTGPTTFTATANDFVPAHDIDLLIFNPPH